MSNDQIPALQFVQGKDWDSAGVVCQFFVVDEHTGVKFYRKAKVGHNEYLKSKVAHKLGFGPRVWGLDKSRGCKDNGAAFYVQRVDVAAEIYRNMNSYINRCEFEEWGNAVGTLLSQEVSQKFSNTKYTAEIDDLHLGNIGLIDGRPCIVDFSHSVIGNLPHCDFYRYSIT